MSPDKLQHELTPEMEEKIKSFLKKYLIFLTIASVLLIALMFGLVRWNERRVTKRFNDYVKNQQLLYEQKSKELEEQFQQKYENALKNLEETDEKMKGELDDSLKTFEEESQEKLNDFLEEVGQ